MSLSVSTVEEYCQSAVLVICFDNTFGLTLDLYFVFVLVPSS